MNINDTKSHYQPLLTLVLFLCTIFLSSDLTAKSSPDPETKLDLYLLIGQSNMAGRGEVAEQDQEVVPRVWTLDQEHQWVPAQDPIHFDKNGAGVGPGRTFGIKMAEQVPDVEIGLIPCAVGGTSLYKWRPGAEDSKTNSRPYDDMLKRLHIAMEHGTVKGILWHQGEADSYMGSKGKYGENLLALIERVRAECGSADVPFVIGQLGQFEGKKWSEGRTAVDADQRQLAQEQPLVGFVSSEGLEDKGDGTHFGAEAARTLGERFAEKMIELQKK